MKNPYVRLVLRLSVVLLGIVLISKLHSYDEHVLAEAGVEMIAASVRSETVPADGGENGTVTDSDRPVPVEAVEVVADAKTDSHDESGKDIVKTVDSEPEDTQPSEQSEPEDVDIQTGNDTPPVADVTPEPDEADGAGIDSDAVTDNPDDQVEPEPITPDPEDPTLYEGLNELQAAELHAGLDPAYRSTAEYIKALLMTHPDHYNEDIVTQARSMPLESNDARYEFLTGKGYKAYTTKDMPDGYQSEARAGRNMVTFDVPVWKMNSDGSRYSAVWSITINEKLAASVRCIFSDIYLLDIKFPFNYLKGFMYRKVGGSGLISSPLMSVHSFGAAIDINYWDPDNDYYLGKGNDLRDKSNPYCIPDEVIDIFADYGWFWGGNFDICADTMHFQYFGLEFLQYESEEPFPILYRGAENMSSTYIDNLAKRLVKLGYLDEGTSKFTRKVEDALKAFQEDYGLEPDGIADYETWVPLINATHDMSYVF